MGYEVIVNKDGTYLLWNTVISEYQPEVFNTCEELAEYVAKPYYKGEEFSPEYESMYKLWLMECQDNAQPIEEFEAGLIRIPMEKIEELAEAEFSLEDLEKIPFAKCLLRELNCDTLTDEDKSEDAKISEIIQSYNICEGELK